MTLVLAHSPLLAAAQTWGRVPALLSAAGHEVVVLDVGDDDLPPHAPRYIARAALQVAAAAPPGEPCALIGWSGAGPLLPQLGVAVQAGGRPVAGYLFVDAPVPRVGASRLDLLPAAAAAELRALLAAGGSYPDWAEADLPDLADPVAVLGALRPRGLGFFAETLPVPPDWPDAPCGLLQLSPAYDAAARLARSRGWTVLALEGAGHLAALSDPHRVTGALLDLLSPA